MPEAWHLFWGDFNSLLILSVLYDVFSSYYKDVVDFNRRRVKYSFFQYCAVHFSFEKSKNREANNHHLHAGKKTSLVISLRVIVIVVIFIVSVPRSSSPL